MITDDTIDVSTAKFWCLFSDKALAKSLEQQKDKITNEVELGSILMYASLLFTGMSLVNLVTPYLKNLWKKFSTKDKNVLAKVVFEADGKDYTSVFETSSMKWKLMSNTGVTDQETISFFQTQFFNAFKTQCSTYLEMFYSQKEQIKKNIAQVKDSNVKKFLNDMLSNERALMMNLVAGKYQT